MKHLSLAAKYRPQRFVDVAGQPLAAAALSRAALEDKVAPAYLLSGTRGVGKTTIARIFAKALNCEKAPQAEPCNECAQCRHITAGNHVDVSEIDGASNTGVDDVRALRETIGFVPMEGRYKIFIVDEAHMLSKNAFNALLKTLEEPPAHTVFIFATTEAHRFPATIISRCQHFVFRHLPEQAIHEHLLKILGSEGISWEEDAVRLLARRAAGSVRDSLSLLDQALALAGGKLEAEAVRSALGVAGPELYGQLLEAIAAADCPKIIELSGSLLASGVDMGFFTRELASTLRNLFLVRQTNGKILDSLPDITADEKTFLQARAPLLSAAHLHAAWQMTLDSQRGISQSPEPGAALELLLINLALLPQLMPIGSPELEYASGRTRAVSAAGAEGDTQANSFRADWQGFCEFCRRAPDLLPADMLGALGGIWQNGILKITVPSTYLWERLEEKREALEAALKSYCRGEPPALDILRPEQPKAASEFIEQCGQKPELQLCQKILGASIKECKPVSGGRNA